MSVSLFPVLWVCMGISAVALGFAFARSRWIFSQAVHDPKIREVGAAIREGSMAFLSREYKILAGVALLVAALLTYIQPYHLKLVSVSFLVGASLSALAGYFGMRVATTANMRTTAAAQRSLLGALHVAFSGGLVMGLSVVGLGLLGLCSLLQIYSYYYGNNISSLRNNVLPLLNGFAMGASMMALFARVGGGIYTKAADIGADLVGKVESGIPEDDPRNPATIADNVGDNVGDVAGMGADLFESYVGAIVSAMILGATSSAPALIFLPLIIAGCGIVSSIAGGVLMPFLSSGQDPQKSLTRCSIFAGGCLLISSYFVVQLFGPEGNFFLLAGKAYKASGLFYCILGGHLCGIAIGMITEHYTGSGSAPVLQIIEASKTGPATNIISGLSVGMRSTGLTSIFLGSTVLTSFHFAGIYGVAIAALGMLATTGVQLAVDAYGPIADNAGGLAQMCNLPQEVRARTDKLDAVGNTTAAIGKGFAIGSGALTALALFTAFSKSAQIDSMDLGDAFVISGLLVGSMLPFLFSSLALESVGRAAGAMIQEVRRQFREIPGILQGTGKPDYAKCVDISTTASLKEMIIPGLLAVCSPVIAGTLFGPKLLAGMLAGATGSGVMLAIFMANSGGAWDNAKKAIELLPQGKGSDLHAAAVTGDTVGDPFKDTAGPALNILIKLMSSVSLVMAPFLK